MARLQRQTVDLSSYPELAVIYLGMKVTQLRGVGTVMKMGPRIKRSVEQKPDGLLLHENFLFSLWPLRTRLGLGKQTPGAPVGENEFYSQEK